MYIWFITSLIQNFVLGAADSANNDNSVRYHPSNGYSGGSTHGANNAYYGRDSQTFDFTTITDPNNPMYDDEEQVSTLQLCIFIQ